MEKLRAHVRDLSAKAEHKDPFVEVQHLLIGFSDRGNPTIPGSSISRSKDEAEQLVADLYSRISAGEDFDALVREHTEDSHPGIYGMVLNLADKPKHPGAYPRNGMVAAFGNVGWRLAVGEVGVAAHDARTSPYGWHIVKRLR